MEGTRVELLNALDAWRQDPTAPRVFWLNGMAGTGKSAIARSFCHMLARDNELGGSFFCSRGTLRDDVKRIFPTLAMSLAQRFPTYRLALLDVLREDPDAAQKKLEVQVERLLEQPLHAAFGDKTPTLVLAIDALDECADDKATGLMLTTLISKLPRIPVKFFITSRPERHIRAQLESGRPDIHFIRLHDVENVIVEADISCYLTNTLHAIRAVSNSYTFPPEWPSHVDIAILTKLAGSLFIYAFTALEYVRDDDPVERLKTLTGFVGTPGKALTKNLDAIYTHILSKALDSGVCEDEERSVTKYILAAILTVREPLCLDNLGGLIGMPGQRIRSRLDRLHAVIEVPPQDDRGVVSPFHASFGDYLTSRKRANDLFIDPSDGHHILAHSCIENMASKLRFNLSGCRTSHLPNSDQNLTPLHPHLIYSCLYWPHHLTVALDKPLVYRALEVFQQKFLFWLEVLSVVQKVDSASSLVMMVLTAEIMVCFSLDCGMQ